MLVPSTCNYNETRRVAVLRDFSLTSFPLPFELLRIRSPGNQILSSQSHRWSSEVPTISSMTENTALAAAAVPPLTK